jgi:hypothetical protein
MCAAPGSGSPAASGKGRCVESETGKREGQRGVGAARWAPTIQRVRKVEVTDSRDGGNGKKILCIPDANATICSPSHIPLGDLQRQIKIYKITF